jgi:hypothetical protein
VGKRLAMNFAKGLCLLWALAACSSDRAESNVTYRDSTGIRIVESLSPRWGEEGGWAVDSLPVLDLATSGTGGGHEFFRVRDAFRSPDGRVAVADFGAREVRVFSSEGRLVASQGQNGDGPGEFRRLQAIDPFAGDSVSAFDARHRRVTVLGPNLEVARVIPLDGLADGVRDLRPVGDSLFLGLFFSFEPSPARTGRIRMPYAVVQLSRVGAVQDTVTIIPGYESFGSVGVDMSPPFSMDGHLAVRGSEFVLGSADGMGFDRYREDSDRIQRVRVPGYDLSLSPAEVEREREAMLPEGAPERRRQVIEGLEFPENRPAYSNILIDSEGYVWAGEFHGLAEVDRPTTWEVFSPEGVWLGPVRMPARFTLLDIGPDFVLGVFRDGLDVQHVQILRLHRS